MTCLCKPGLASQHRLPRMVDVLRTLWRQRASRHLSIALILLCTMGLGLGPWYAAFMIRSHGMDTTELGIWLGLILGIGGSYLGARTLFEALRSAHHNETAD